MKEPRVRQPYTEPMLRVELIRGVDGYSGGRYLGTVNEFVMKVSYD